MTMAGRVHFAATAEWVYPLWVKSIYGTRAAQSAAREIDEKLSHTDLSKDKSELPASSAEELTKLRSLLDSL